MTLDLYDREFFVEYGALNSAYADACAFIAKEIHRRFSPRTVVDWGCGAGLHASALARLGADVVAVDGVVVDDDLRAPDVAYRTADITRPVPPGLVPDDCDLSLCLDVLEHIEEAGAAAALANVIRGARLVILSCAPPGQGGHGHVNEQPRRYWVRRMQELGWRYERRETGSLERYFLDNRDRVPLSWMYHNLCVYRPLGGAVQSRR